MKTYVSKLAQAVYDAGKTTHPFFVEVWADALEHLSMRAPRMPADLAQIRVLFAEDVQQVVSAKGPKSRRLALLHLMAVCAWWVIRSHASGEDLLH